MPRLLLVSLLALALGASIAAAAPHPQTGSGLSTIVPPPPCLYDCIQKSTNCAVCTPAGDAAITACYEATCGQPPDGNAQYAGVYYGSICADGGYLDYTSTPHQFVVIPPANCSH